MAVSYLLDDEVGGRVYSLAFKQVGHNGTDGGTHGCIMYLFKIPTLEEEICIFEAELSQCGAVMYGHGSSVM